MDKPDSTMSGAEGASCGGAVAGSIFGTIACIILLVVGAWLFYKKYWKNKSESNPLVEDAENSKVDYAFDNPAFKGDNNKNASPFDSKWKTPDKRKTVDDSYANATIPRLVPLRGSDFTGLGIEVCGGLKDGIFVSKVMPQGPAANIVHRGDKITSITIDFRHIVQEDAATILSYASPYNVQLELVDSNGMLSNVLTQNVNQPAALTHPLYRPRSQEDLNTIERNARKKLFSKDDNSYPTLKMDQQQQCHVQPKPRSPAIQLPQAHEENEKKNSLKKIQNYFIDMVEEKFQTKASHSNDSNTDGKKGMKFGIRVLPPSLNGKDSGKSPNKVQADNDNNANIEKIENTIEPMQQQQQQQQPQHPQSPAPPEAMKRSKNKSQDAKKANNIQDDNKPVLFVRQASINSSGIKRDAAGIPQEVPTEMMQAAMTAVNNRTKVNSIDRKSKGKAPIPPARGEYDESSADNVDNMHVVKMETVEMPQITTMKVSIEGSQPDLDSDAEFNGKSVQQIELNSKHITVHQASEEEEESNEERRTASLGDLSKLEHNKCINNKNRPTNGTLERAQSLEISDANNQIAAGKVTPKKRKAHPSDHDLVEVMELKEPRFSEPIIEHLEPLQTVRLKSSYEWGNLEDAIYDGKDKNASDDSFELESPQKKLSASSMDMMSEVLAAADKFDKEINDIELHDVMNEMPQVEFDDGVNGTMDETIRLELMQNKGIDVKLSAESSSSDDMNDIQTVNNGIMIETNDKKFVEDANSQQNVTQINLPTATVHLEVKSNDNHFEDIVIDSSKGINYGTNVSDDAKASRYPLSTLERPKSEVLKQLIAQQVPGDADDKSMEMNGISYAKSVSNDGPINISVAVHSDSDASEPVQISPVFSSDGSGINNISITSSESDSKDSTTSPAMTTTTTTTTTTENRITISTSESQPASIVIEDETLNFKMQTLDDEPKEQQPLTKTQSANGSPKKNEVFIVESLSSKKSHESLLPVSQNGRDAKPPTPDNKGFVTEIRFPNANKDKHMNAKNLSKSIENKRNHSPETKNRPHDAKTSSPNDGRKTTTTTTTTNEKPVIVEEEYIPRNNEIRFTTSTYQSPRHQFEKRHSQIDQIRSNFERSHTNSEIPVPIRKTSTPSTPPPPQSTNVARVSPSKIPVFTSQKSSDNLLKNNNSTNRVSVTSIKNSSRNPSGK